MVSCTWSLSLALGYPQPEWQEAAFEHCWYCSPWFCNCKTLLLAKFEFMAVITKLAKEFFAAVLLHFLLELLLGNQ